MIDFIRLRLALFTRFDVCFLAGLPGPFLTGLWLRCDVMRTHWTESSSASAKLHRTVQGLDQQI
jgi:hypothetical protein